MIKNIIKWTAIVFGALIALLIVAALVIPLFLPLDKIKDIAAEKASDAIHRDVKIGKVSFNIFKGVELRNISVSNRPGFSKEPFISTNLVELKYDFWALLKGKVRIDKVVLVRPEILVEQRADMTNNYQDLVGTKKPKEPKPSTKKNINVDLLVNKFAIVDGKLTQVSYTPEGKKVIQLKGLKLDIANISLATKTPMLLMLGVTGVYEGKDVPVTLTGKIDFDINGSYLNARGFSLTAAGEKLMFDAEVTNFDKAPNIKAKIYSPKIDTDKFLAIVSGTGTKKAKKVVPVYGVQTRSINKSVKSVPSNIKAAITIDLNNILFKEMKVDSVRTNISFSNKVMSISNIAIAAYRGTITGKVVADLNISGIAYTVDNIIGKGFDATPASNDVIESFLTKLPDYKDLRDKLDGALSFRISLTGKGVETPDIIANANAKGSFALVNGKIGKLKTLSAIGEKLKISTFNQDIALKEFKADFRVSNKIATISGLTLNNGEAGDLKVAFDGSANIDTLAWVKGNKLSLKLNPKNTKDLASEYDVFKDANGWVSLDFEMTGSLKKPIPIPLLSKPLENLFNNKKKELEKGVNKQIDTKKKELQDAAQKEIDAQKKAAEDAAKAEAERIKKEAEEKAKQELENKAKELLKF